MLYNTSSSKNLCECQILLIDIRGAYTFSSKNIVRLEASDNYTIVYFNNQQRPFTVSKVLKVYDELLKPYGFVRTHRSHLVNKQFVAQVNRNSVVMQDGSIVRITHGKKKACISNLA